MNTVKDFAGLAVAAFESRRADDVARLIERYGGIPYVSPSMREVPLEDDRKAVDFAHRLITGEVGIVIFLTGVGFRHLLAAVERHVDRQRYLETLSDVTTIVRGPKPQAAMKEVGLTPTYRVPSPNTWRELLKTVDENLSVANQAIGLQEYGKNNPSLIAGLEARGGHVIQVPVYKWELPEDTKPLEDNIRAIANGERQVALFTSAQQVHNVLLVAEQLGCLAAVRKQFQQLCVASVGPTTSEALRDCELPVDLEPSNPKMGPLVSEAAENCKTILQRKQRVSVMLSGPTSDPHDPQAPWYNSPFMKACRREPTDVTPVWLMRQAGRYMAEYREVRAKTTFLELCKNPQLCS
ncbi:MAG: uroporphyrinogen decarboxylase, partial [Pirellulaceae bacterium]